jgi:hypothetical protein
MRTWFRKNISSSATKQVDRTTVLGADAGDAERLLRREVLEEVATAFQKRVKAPLPTRHQRRMEPVPEGLDRICFRCALGPKRLEAPQVS